MTTIRDRRGVGHRETYRAYIRGEASQAELSRALRHGNPPSTLERDVALFMVAVVLGVIATVLVLG